MSALGQKRTCAAQKGMSAFGVRADIVADVAGLARVGLMQTADSAA